MRKVTELGGLDWKSWQYVSGVYVGLKAKTPEGTWDALWDASKLYRTGQTQTATPLVQALAAYDPLRQEMRKIWARESGFNAERERKRRAKDPEAYKKANTERRRKRRALLKSQAAISETASTSVPSLNAPETSYDDRDEKAAAE